MEKNSSPAETSGKQKVRSAEVGTDILKALAELSPATSLSRLAEHVGMPASKVHRYLQALIASGFAVQDASTNHYSLGREALRVGLAALDSMDVLKSAAAPLAELRDVLNETCFLAVWGNRGATVVQVEQAVRAVTVVTQVGSVLPLLGSSTGLVFAAFLPEREVAELREEELAGRADHPLADPAAYAVLLEGIRARPACDPWAADAWGGGALGTGVRRPRAGGGGAHGGRPGEHLPGRGAGASGGTAACDDSGYQLADGV